MTNPHQRASEAALLPTCPPWGDRARRLMWLLTAAWIVNLFDLGFTLLAHEMQVLEELNPIAARVIPLGTIPTIIYKIALLTIGTSLLWRYRRCRLAEHGAWGYALICVGLALWWHQLYIDVEPIVHLAGATNEFGTTHPFTVAP